MLWLCLPIEKRIIIFFCITQIFYSVHPQFNQFSHSLYILARSSLSLLELYFKPPAPFHCQMSSIPPGSQLSEITFAPSCHGSGLLRFSMPCIGAQPPGHLCFSLCLTFALVAGSELFCSCLMHLSNGSSCLLVCIFLCHITLTQFESPVLVLAFHKKALARGICEHSRTTTPSIHGTSLLLPPALMLYLVFSLFYSLLNSLSLALYLYSLLTYRNFHWVFSFLHSCYIISVGSYLQSRTAYLGIFLNKIIP